MDSVRSNPLVCEACQREFSSVSNKNKHQKKFHGEGSTKVDRIKHIRCPICTTEDNEEQFSFYNKLDEHLSNLHGILMKGIHFTFRNVEEFEAWRIKENRDVDYVCVRRYKIPNGDTAVNYLCNRSHYRAFQSVGQHKRQMKSGGSIHIQGVCPSRIIVKILREGQVEVQYILTHVGHEDELRAKRLSKSVQDMLVVKLNTGVSKERIIQDARKFQDDNKLQRMNLITRGDLAYLIRKFNIDQRRDADDMIATGLKVAEWNKHGTNFAFFYKKIGESYPGLRDGDFAVAYMNGIMEKKLRDFKRIICVDGTHGTNRNNWDLTIVLVKDEKNMGFPVAFLLSNRLDQAIQEIFFSGLKSRLGEMIQADFFMSDDDPKYFNAWTKVMTTGQKPQRLLCTWHVVKNWNIQGRSKIKKEHNRNEMKMKMREILKETDPTKFMQLKENYFRFLEKESENDFLKYLQNYYFQNHERITMWAHCYRINAGINTNMAIESLNKVLKYNKMKGQRNLRVEKLLDLLDELVEEKMWTRIINVERPNANSYHHKITLNAHKKAEEMLGTVEICEFGKFKVSSCSVSGKFYIVNCKEFCDTDCRAGYCNICKICIHTYDCQCPEYTIKKVLCKHIHAVSLLEGRSESFAGSICSSDDQLYIQEPTATKLSYQDDVAHFIQETTSRHTTDLPSDIEERRDIALEEHISFIRNLRSLDGNTFDRLIAGITKLKSDLDITNQHVSKKRKVERQSYFPNK